MNYLLNNRLAQLMVLVLILATLLVAAVSCEPSPPFQVKNKTDQTLYIFFAVSYLDYVEADAERVLEGEVKPGEVLSPTTLPFPRYLIEARDEKGNVVYSREFSCEELESINWKATISKSQ